MIVRKGKKVVAEEEVMTEEVEVAPEAAEMMFEAEDVAELLAEVTGREVTVDVTDDATACTIEVGEDVFEIDASDAEVLYDEEAAPAPVAESRRLRARKPVAASKKPAGRVIKRMPRK